MQLKTVKIEKPDDTNFILGQTHFVKQHRSCHGRHEKSRGSKRACAGSIMRDGNRRRERGRT